MNENLIEAVVYCLDVTNGVIFNYHIVVHEGVSERVETKFVLDSSLFGLFSLVGTRVKLIVEQTFHLIYLKVLELSSNLNHTFYYNQSRSLHKVYSFIKVNRRKEKINVKMQ